jgi:hypothetical protein
MSLTLDLGTVVNEAIDKKLETLDIESQIKELLGAVAQKASKVIEVKVDGKEDGVKLNLVHKQFEQLLKTVSIQGINTLLTGGAGLSKSTAVMQVAKALQLEYRSISFSNQTTKTDLLGFVDANGVYKRSSFIQAFEEGMVFLADEMDACSSNVLVLLNSAIANGVITTPDNRLIEAHENFRFVGTANTNLRGQNNGYVARNKLDSATIDRFTVIEWLLDEDLESKITDNDGWVEIVRSCRTIAKDNLDGIEITPRSSYDGAKLLKAGFDIDEVIQMTIVKGLGKDEAKTLTGKITKEMKNKAIIKDIPKHLETEPTEPPIHVEPKHLETEPEIDLFDEDIIGDDEDIIGDDNDFKW